MFANAKMEIVGDLKGVVPEICQPKDVIIRCGRCQACFESS